MNNHIIIGSKIVGAPQHFDTVQEAEAYMERNLVFDDCDVEGLAGGHEIIRYYARGEVVGVVVDLYNLQEAA